jgi:hypothetical protein
LLRKNIIYCSALVDHYNRESMTRKYTQTLWARNAAIVRINQKSRLLAISERGIISLPVDWQKQRRSMRGTR